MEIQFQGASRLGRFEGYELPMRVLFENVSLNPKGSNGPITVCVRLYNEVLDTLSQTVMCVNDSELLSCPEKCRRTH